MICQKALFGKIIQVLAVVFFIVIFTLGSSEAGFFHGQSFEAPMENGTIYGHLINENFSKVTGAIWESNLLKAGFFLVLLITIIQIGFNAGGGLKEAATYIFVFLLLTAPLIKGKSLLLTAADLSDSLTKNIVDRIGTLNYQFAGSAVATMMAGSTVSNDVLHKYRNELYQFKHNCYDIYNAQNPNPAESPFKTDYGVMVVPPDAVTPKVVSISDAVFDVTCNDYKERLGNVLVADFRGRLKNYRLDLAGNDKKGVEESPQDKQILDALRDNITAEELVDKGAATYSENPTDKSQPGFWRSALRALTTRQGMANLIMIMPRLLICEIGILFVYVFNYYIFQIVTIIKTIAAIGMAFGVLYYMFLRKIDLPLNALAVWVFANGWYIIAAIGMNQYWKAVMDTPWSSIAAQVIFGTQGAVMNGLFGIGLIGLLGSVLAAILSWQGLKFSLGKMGGGGISMPRIGPPGGGSGGGKV